MSFSPIDLDTYPRHQHYLHYFDLRLAYSTTVSIDITTLRAAVKEHGLRIFPAQIWLLTTAANRIPEFRMSRDDQGTLGIWDHLEPTYTAMKTADQPFSSVWTPYDPDFGAFYRHCLSDMERWPDGTFDPQGNEPPNVLNISSIPWIAFTSFTLNYVTDYLLPILTIGKHTEEQGRTFMPLSIQVHHAVCDGYHVGQFISQIEQLVESAPNWISPES